MYILIGSIVVVMFVAIQIAEVLFEEGGRWEDKWIGAKTTKKTSKSKEQPKDFDSEDK